MELTLKQLKRTYKFLDDVDISFLDTWGETAFTAGPSRGYINIYTQSIKEFQRTLRFQKRFGKVSRFKGLMMVLFHEIYHVYQHKTIDPIVMLQELKAIADSGRHDESWIEQDADAFARKEIKKYKNLTKLKL